MIALWIYIVFSYVAMTGAYYSEYAREEQYVTFRIWLVSPITFPVFVGIAVNKIMRQL